MHKYIILLYLAFLLFFPFSIYAEGFELDDLKSDQHPSLYIRPVRMVQDVELIPWQPHVRFKPGTWVHEVMSWKERFDYPEAFDDSLFLSSKRIEEVIRWRLGGEALNQTFLAYEDEVKSAHILVNDERMRAVLYGYLTHHKKRLASTFESSSEQLQQFNEIYNHYSRMLQVIDMPEYPSILYFDVSSISGESAENILQLLPQSSDWRITDRHENIVRVQNSTARNELSISESWTKIKVSDGDIRYYKEITDQQIDEEYFVRLSFPRFERPIAVSIKELPLGKSTFDFQNVPDITLATTHLHSIVDAGTSDATAHAYVQFAFAQSDVYSSVIELSTSTELTAEYLNSIEMSFYVLNEPTLIVRNVSPNAFVADQSLANVSSKDYLVPVIVFLPLMTAAFSAVWYFRRSLAKVWCITTLPLLLIGGFCVVVLSSSLFFAVFGIVLWVLVGWRLPLRNLELLASVMLLAGCILTALLGTFSVTLLQIGLCFLIIYLVCTMLSSRTISAIV